MNVRAFLDTNIFVYAFLNSGDPRSAEANALISGALADDNSVVSYQLVQEFINVVSKKSGPQWNRSDLRQYIHDVLSPMLKVHSSLALFESAVEFQSSSGISWYDSLIVAAAVEAHCDVLFTEDLQHGQKFGELTIQNPFRQIIAT